MFNFLTFEISSHALVLFEFLYTMEVGMRGRADYLKTGIRQEQEIPCRYICFTDCDRMLPQVASVRHLGAKLDQKLTFHEHYNDIVLSSFCILGF